MSIETIISQIPLWEVLMVISCLLLSAFFSSAETALTSISPTKAMQLIESKAPGSQHLKYWFHNPGKIITTILIGNNVVNIVCTAFTTLIAERIFDSTGIAVTLGILTFLILTFGEIVPKIIARDHSVKISLVFIRFLLFFYFLFYPFTFLLVGVTELLFRKSKFYYPRKGPLVTLKDLDFFISLAQKEGSLIGSKGSFLKAVSEFSELRVKNIMVPKSRVTVLNADISVVELTEIIKRDMYTRYPVINDNDTFIGILNAKDFLLNIEKCEEENSVVDILRPAFWTNEFMKVDFVLELMKARKTQLFLVKDEYNQFCGVVTMEDILEELVGEIEDEHDLENVEEDYPDQKTFIVEGEDSVHDLNVKYELDIPEDKDFQTFNGFMLDLCNGVLPKKDNVLEWKNLKIRIIKNKDKNIEKAEITITDKKED